MSGGGLPGLFARFQSRVFIAADRLAKPLRWDLVINPAFQLAFLFALLAAFFAWVVLKIIMASSTAS